MTGKGYRIGEAEFPDGVAVVLGGSGGVGRAIAALLAARGTDVALTYRHNAAAADETRRAVEAHGRRCETAAVDLADFGAVQAMFDGMADRFGRIHTVVAATGADISMTYVADVAAEEWHDTIERDLTGFFNAVKAAIPHLRNGGGSIVAITSAGLVRHPPKDILSTVPKAGVEALIRGIAREEGRHGIRANAVALGVIDAGLFHRLEERLTPDFVAAMKRNAALRRFGSADEAAEAVVFLASSRGGYITGHSLVVDGGFSV